MRKYSMNKKKKKPLVSIIIRTKNEEKWISSCLRAIETQSYKNHEVIIVDNDSSDNTIKKTKKFKVKLLKIKKFKPGNAINFGIKRSKGDLIVCLSGHCIPVDKNWLSNLVKNTKSKKVAGVYGRQEPFSFSSDIDKRDLINTFGLDRKIQIKDTFFHNANSCFSREIWKKFPFDDNVTNIEDRVWAEKVISCGYKIIYEPRASVYHYHGINHDRNVDRAKNVVKILETLSTTTTQKNKFNREKLKIAALIPITGKTKFIKERSLLEIAIRSAQKSNYIQDVIVLADNDETIKLAKLYGAKVPFKRPISLSESYISVNDILKYSIEELEKNNNNYDLVVCLEETYPFRKPEIIDLMIKRLLNENLDTIFAGKIEKREIWFDRGGDSEIILKDLMPRDLKKDKVVISLFGLGCVTHPGIIKRGNLFSGKTGIFEVRDKKSQIEVRDKQSLDFAKDIYYSSN
jgi:rhamnosyltransferase